MYLGQYVQYYYGLTFPSALFACRVRCVFMLSGQIKIVKNDFSNNECRVVVGLLCIKLCWFFEHTCTVTVGILNETL